jgi:O-antigen ligase
VLWGLVSSLWAIEPHRSLIIAMRLTGLFAAGLALIAAASKIHAPQRLMLSLMAGFVLSLVLAAAQFATHGALTAALSRRPYIGASLNDIEDGFVLLLPPICATLLLQQRRIAAGTLAGATVIAIFLLAGDAARLGFIIGLAAAVSLYLGWGWLSRAAAIASVIFILAAPLILPSLANFASLRQDAAAFKISVWHRLEIWSFVGGKIAEKPMLGWGLDSSRAIPGGDVIVPGSLLYLHETWLPLHPHDAALQLWLELGVPGAILLAALVVCVWLALATAPWPPLYAAAAGGSLVTALVVGFSSYGVWQEWWIGTQFLTLFLILVLARLSSIAAALRPDQ